MAWWDYVKRISNSASANEIARRTQIGQSSVARWQNSSPKTENVVAFARAYDRPVLEAFVEAGFLTKEDAGLTHIQADLSQVPLEDLLYEAWRRVREPS